MTVAIHVDLHKGTITGDFTVNDKLPLIDALEAIAGELIHGGLACVDHIDGKLHTTGNG